MMARIGRIIVRTIAASITFLVVLLLVFDRLVQFRMDDKELLTWFHERHVEPQIGRYQAMGRQIRYITVGNKQ